MTTPNPPVPAAATPPEPDDPVAVLTRAAKYAESEALGRPYRRGISERASADTFALREMARLVEAWREAEEEYERVAGTIMPRFVADRLRLSARRALLRCLRGAPTPTETKEGER